MNLLDFMVHIAHKALERPDRYLAPGHNGPYHDPETPVRIYGHWLITFAACFEWTGNHAFKDKAAELAEFLCSAQARPYGYSFHHRNKNGKDSCNGLIGQAWTFEALATAACHLGEEKYARRAEQVFFQHQFNEQSGLWNILEIDGKLLNCDPTFNHQLWFAACSSLLQSAGRPEIMRRVKVFMDRLDRNLTVLPNGLIFHPISPLCRENLLAPPTLRDRVAHAVAHRIKEIKKFRWPSEPPDITVTRKQRYDRLLYKSIGYHAFNTYAFALLIPGLPEHPFWSSEAFKRMCSYLLSKQYKADLDLNKYGYPYNPPGFEVPCSVCGLLNQPAETLLAVTTPWVNEQVRRSYNHQTGRLDRNTDDPATQTARMYELTRLPLHVLEAVALDVPAEG